MLLRADVILGALAQEVARLPMDSAWLEGSSSQSIRAALGLLAQRERGGSAALRAQCATLASRIASIAGERLSPALREGLAQLQAALREAAAVPGLHDQEDAWRHALEVAEGFMALLTEDANLDPETRSRLLLVVTRWESADLEDQWSRNTESAPDLNTSVSVTRERLASYLRSRFADETLTVTEFRSLPGGFGKQTFLFDVSGSALSGAFVLRRDLAMPLLSNDCHCAGQEFALIRAVHARGFPAPEAVWLDTDHALMPGGDFFVMRRSPGVTGGSVFQAQAGVPADLAETLAGILARLHALPPIPELGSLTESLNADVWAQPLEQCVKGYLDNWLAMFRREEHLASPAIVGLFGWLLANIPPMRGRPVLLHGDIGFHNFLFERGSLTAVLDWEFGHLGDPAEDLAYVRNTLGNSLDWPAFLAAYGAAGGAPVDYERLRFFQVWGHVRNACASNLVSSKLAYAKVDDLKLVLLPHVYIPQMLNAARALIEAPV